MPIEAAQGAPTDSVPWHVTALCHALHAMDARMSTRTSSPSRQSLNTVWFRAPQVRMGPLLLLLAPVIDADLACLERRWGQDRSR